ncbi:MAG: DMT family transporter [Dermatophilaceae bacterium]
MSESNSAIRGGQKALLIPPSGLIWGFIGVAAFSFTVPLTRVAVQAGMNATFVGAARSVVAGLLAAGSLVLTRQAVPRAGQWVRVVVVALGVVVGFPMLTSFALVSTPASHGAVVIATLPAATAVAVVMRTSERPSRSFWITAVLGMVAAVVFAAIQGGGLGELHAADAMLFGAVVAAAIGYAEGGVLAKELGAWQTVSWALVVALPIMLVLTLGSVAPGGPGGTPVAWLAFAYLSVVSMFLGYFAWYHGLAIGPMARVSQIQLTQPVMSISWAALLLGEALTWPTVLGGTVVVLLALSAVRARAVAARPTLTSAIHSTAAP